MYNLAIKDNSDIVICDMADYYEDGTKVIHNCTKYDFVYKVTPSACNKIFKSTVIKEIRFLDGLWYEDLNFTTKILLKDPKISTISDLYYNCNVRDSSIMNSENSIKNLDIIKIIDDLRKYAKENDIYKENIFEYLIFDHILITTINRVTKQKSKDKKKVIKALRKYCKENLKNYKEQEFYRTIPKNRKIIASLNYYGLQNLSKMLLNIKSKIN